MTDPDVVTLFATAEVTPEPPLPAGFVDHTLTRARRSTRRRRIAGILATVAALALLLPWPGRIFDAPRPAAPAATPSLPGELAPYSALTASARSSPAGRAIALYESGSSELFTTWQTLVAGADRDTYRTVALGNDSAPKVLLSPDGEHLLFHENKVGTDEFTLQDLATAKTRVLHSVTWQSIVGAGIDMLAWSPDGRYVAYAVPAPPPGGGKADSSYLDGRPMQHLAILDVVTDATTRYPDLGPVRGAAFAPDSRHLAVQLGHELWIVTTDGRRERQVTTLPAGTDLISGTAWSPDSALIAIGKSTSHMAANGSTTNDRTIEFVDATGTGQVTPYNVTVPCCSDVLAWRDPTTILSMDGDTGLVEVNIRTGKQRTLSRFSTAHACEYGLQRCGTYRMQVATGLVASATVRPSNPDRGPWPTPVRTAAIGLTVVGGLIAWGTFRLVRRRVPAAGSRQPR